MSSRKMNRRAFLNKATALAAGVAGTGMRLSKARSASSRSGKTFVVGIMGMGGRGCWLIGNALALRPDVEIAYVCDVDAKHLAAGVREVEQQMGNRPKAVSDFRRILDDKSVHALFNVTPDHWHALPTIMACQAGKDVYCEKPASHNIWEGRKMIEAARKYKRIVQIGSQNRSAPYAHAAVEYIRSGKLGDVHLVRVLNMKDRKNIGHEQDSPVPQGVDYDTWLGPAPKRSFRSNRFHYGWHWFWDYSGGDIINDGVHQIDLARMLIGKEYPNAVSATGGIHHFDDDRETPDTHVVTWDYNRITMVFELTLWTPYLKKTSWDYRDTDGFPDWQFNATQIQVFGTKGLMFMGRHGGGWQVYDADHKPVAAGPGRHPHNPHVKNFFDCVLSRKTPNADIEVGHRSTILCHLGNISYRLGGRKLHFDGKTEMFINDDQANQMVKRAGRVPWRIPETV